MDNGNRPIHSLREVGGSSKDVIFSHWKHDNIPRRSSTGNLRIVGVCKEIERKGWSLVIMENVGCVEYLIHFQCAQP